MADTKMMEASAAGVSMEAVGRLDAGYDTREIRRHEKDEKGPEQRQERFRISVQ
jgi:hypothetical protein